MLGIELAQTSTFDIMFSNRPWTLSNIPVSGLDRAKAAPGLIIGCDEWGYRNGRQK
jgi:hypothetical protein